RTPDARLWTRAGTLIKGPTSNLPAKIKGRSFDRLFIFPFVVQKIALIPGHGLRLFRILLADFSTQLSFENRQLRLDLLLCFPLLDDLFAVAAQEIVNGLHSNPNRASRLVLVEVFEAEVWRS